MPQQPMNKAYVEGMMSTEEHLFREMAIRGGIHLVPVLYMPLELREKPEFQNCYLRALQVSLCVR